MNGRSGTDGGGSSGTTPPKLGNGVELGTAGTSGGGGDGVLLNSGTNGSLVGWTTTCGLGVVTGSSGKTKGRS